MPIVYGAYFVMLSGGNATTAFVRSRSRLGASYHSISLEPHTQCVLGCR